MHAERVALQRLRNPFSLRHSLSYVQTQPTVAERMKEGQTAAMRLHEELERLRAGGGASAVAETANKYARDAAELSKELEHVRSRLVQSELRADALQRKVDDSVAALEESALLLEKRESSDAEMLQKVLADNQALQRALLKVDEKGAIQVDCQHARALFTFTRACMNFVSFVSWHTWYFCLI